MNSYPADDFSRSVAVAVVVAVFAGVDSVWTLDSSELEVSGWESV